jgi:hypothetical protein
MTAPLSDRERLARELCRKYWLNRGEVITDEMEDEFWVSFLKEADRSLLGKGKKEDSHDSK